MRQASPIEQHHTGKAGLRTSRLLSRIAAGAYKAAFGWSSRPSRGSKPVHNRRAVTVTDAPFPLGRASLGNQHFQHGPDPIPSYISQDTGLGAALFQRANRSTIPNGRRPCQHNAAQDGCGTLSTGALVKRGLNRERPANKFANKLPETGRSAVGRVGVGHEEKPNNQGLLGIRTNRGGRPITLFKTGALNHSATLPLQRYQPLSGQKIKNDQ